ncbi:MAG: cbb3-type cytochrome c oxidase subunit I [Planctomycetota bacterium]|nr:cbb3-type cytochrome c oxidase subunit I [Planctomycetota bacterium]
MSWVWKYVFTTNHKIIGIQFLFTGLAFIIVGGLLAMAIRWQIAWPWKSLPILGSLFRGPAEAGGSVPTIAAEDYTLLFTMHGSVMIFFVIIPLLTGAFGNYLIPLMIGARDMAFPRLNMFSYWAFVPASICIVLSFFVEGGAASSGWTAYPPLSIIADAAPGSGTGQTLWLVALLFVGLSSLMGSVNYITTIVKMRAPGMTMFRMPLTVWSLFITAILQAFALPVLTAALTMQFLDKVAGTTFFLPAGLVVSNTPVEVAGGGNPLLWQHLFWFYSHPAVYIMILPAMGIVSDLISTFARKPLFGYVPMVLSICGIAGLGFIVWGHHMFQSGMNPALGMTFMVSTMVIALPSAIKTFNWIATLFKGNIWFTTPALFGIAFVSMFIIGGLSGIYMAATPVDIFIHDTYFIVAHIHYVLFAGSMVGIFGGIYFWFPKMFGRMMNETLGKIHFFLTFIALNCTFYMMHIVGVRGMMRRVADPYVYTWLKDLQPLNVFITISAFVLFAVQIIFAVNFIYSLFWGKKAPDNPWNSNTLEWTCSSPPWHENFRTIPTVHHGPYEYASPDVEEDYLPQTRELKPKASEG